MPASHHGASRAHTGLPARPPEKAEQHLRSVPNAPSNRVGTRRHLFLIVLPPRVARDTAPHNCVIQLAPAPSVDLLDTSVAVVRSPVPQPAHCYLRGKPTPNFVLVPGVVPRSTTPATGSTSGSRLECGKPKTPSGNQPCFGGTPDDAMAAHPDISSHQPERIPCRRERSPRVTSWRSAIGYTPPACLFVTTNRPVSRDSSPPQCLIDLTVRIVATATVGTGHHATLTDAGHRRQNHTA